MSNNIKKLLYSILFLLVLIQLSCDRKPLQDEGINPSLTLWYDEPAKEWTEALPVGNGRLGAMVYGGLENETIQFNEETLWTGQPHDYANEGAHEYLDSLRQLLWEGKQEEAHQMGLAHFMSQPVGQLSYQPFGDILLHFPGHEHATGYQRHLNLEKAISTVLYEVDDVAFKREVFASEPAQSVIIHIESSKRGALNFAVSLDSPHSESDVSVEGEQIILKGKANDYDREQWWGEYPYPESKMKFEARLKVEYQGGRLITHENSIEVEDSRSATLYLVAATNFINYRDISADPKERCERYLAGLEGKSYETIRHEHIRDFRSFFNRVHLDLGTKEISKRPTDERLKSFNEDEDPALAALLFQYGRYLMISSSRPGTQPANLQGIWNDQLEPPWDSKHTININAQMNYWPAEMTHLSEFADPLISMVEDLTETGNIVAREHYDLGGWVVHHNTDQWRGAAPINHSNHGIWPTGGAWLSQHLWWRYAYTGDEDFLKNTAYPVLKKASLFFTDYLVPYPENPDWLVSGPSNSPEIGGLVMGPTMDHQIIRNLFSNTAEAAAILGVDQDFAEKLTKLRARIAPNQIGRHGQLQEWLEDIDDPEERHRHVSHLWGLHPGDEIHAFTTPELAEAAKVTLSHRGDGGTGWSMAWKMNFQARLLDGEQAFSLLKNILVPSVINGEERVDRGGVYLNLFGSHPPFQIDGNFGVTSGITEMLLQSHLRDDNGDYYQDLLPALPSRFDSGTISGIKGRGGFEISIDWENGQLVSAEVRSLLGNTLNLRYNGKSLSRKTSPGETHAFALSDFH